MPFSRDTWQRSKLTSLQVLLFSVVGMHHVRVLEAYFDGKELVVGATGLYDLEQRNHELLIQLSRWWLGHAGDRSTEELGSNTTGRVK